MRLPVFEPQWSGLPEFQDWEAVAASPRAIAYRHTFNGHYFEIQRSLRWEIHYWNPEEWTTYFFWTRRGLRRFLKERNRQLLIDNIHHL